jgi:hypothetical protein
MNSPNSNVSNRPSLRMHVHSQHWVYRDKERRRERLRASLTAKSRR